MTPTKRTTPAPPTLARRAKKQPATHANQPADLFSQGQKIRADLAAAAAAPSTDAPIGDAAGKSGTRAPRPDAPAAGKSDATDWRNSPVARSRKGQQIRKDLTAARSTAAQPGDAAGKGDAAGDDLYRDEAAARAGDPAPQLTPLQCLIADLLGDILVHGGQREVIDDLLLAAARQGAYRTYGQIYNDEPEKLRQQVLDTEIPYDWLLELNQEWRRNRKAKPQEQVEPATASGRIRAHFLETLRGQFENFVRECTPEECFVMIEILQLHEANNTGSNDFDEMPLGMAIEDTMGNYQGEWIRVPASLQKQVEAYIACLRAAESCPPAA